MEFLFGILAFAVMAAIPVSIVYLLVSNARLKARVRALELRAGAGGPAVEPEALPEAAPVTAPEAMPEPVPEPVPESLPVRAPVVAREPAPPPTFVLRRENVRRLEHWMRENWFLAVAALSLALAGVFLVQYGVETGLLTPAMRVAGAVLLGLALIGAGEWLRRRAIAAGAEEPTYLPSAFGGAGIVSIFAGILAARQLYGLIGPEAAFIALAATGAGAVLLGWFYGPFLSAVGILGAVAAPFLVGGGAQEPYWLYGYFAIVAAVGLAVDAARRWAWLSAFVLMLAFAAALLLYLAQGGGVWFLAFAVALVVASAAIPVWRLSPTHGGAMVSVALWHAGRAGPQQWPEFPTRLVAGTMLAAVLVAWDVMHGNPGEFAVAFGGVGLLFLLAAVWLRDAPALDDLAAVPAAGFLAMLAGAAVWQVPGYAGFALWTAPDPEALAPLTVSWLVAGAALAGAVAGWRSLRGGSNAVYWTCLAAVAPLAVIVLELFWRPALVLGSYSWALHLLAMAALMTVLAERHKAAEPARALRISILLIMALTLVSLALIVWFTLAALTVALAVMVLAAALLDRRFDLAPLGVFGAFGVGVLIWRLVAVPGLDWAVNAPVQSVLFAHAGVMAALAVARAAAQARARDRQVLLLEAGIWIAAAVLASALIFRWVDAAQGTETESYWHISLQGTVWLVVALAQWRRAAGQGWRAAPQRALAAIAGLVWLAAILPAVTIADPVWGFAPSPVIGPWVLDSLLLAYGLPGAILLAAPLVIRPQRRWAGVALRAAGAGLAALYAAHEIRRLWQGRDLSVPGIADGEQYSYTVAMMALSAGLMLAAWHRRSPVLRQLGVIATALTIAKVFLVDTSGLAGLIRVASFLALGLALAGLAQVNRWMTRAWQVDREADGDDPPS